MINYTEKTLIWPRTTKTLVPFSVKYNYQSNFNYHMKDGVKKQVQIVSTKFMLDTIVLYITIFHKELK